MSSKLDTSLDDILKTRRQTTRRGRGGRRSDAARPAPTGPVGGVGKSTKPAKQAKSAPSGSAIPETTGKILVSGLVSSLLHFAEFYPLTRISPTMSTRTSSRYVRPLQVFELLHRDLRDSNSNQTTKRRCFSVLQYGPIRYNLRKVRP
jgi:hypothetical protein